MRRCFVDLGSNIDRIASLAAAVELLQERFGRLRLSSVYETVALDADSHPVKDEPCFYNMCVEFVSPLEPCVLRSLLRKIEEFLGRRRGRDKYAPRNIDLDLLLCGDLIEKHKGWSVPHGDIVKVGYIIHPLCELAPDLVHPEEGKPLKAIAKTVSYDGIKRLGGLFELQGSSAVDF